jgi:asparagine synthase (glutamine-hydrolysing)
MCGIVGQFGGRVSGPALKNMAQQISARGPDGSDEWVEHGIGFAHRRLAIVDLSPAGAQPMHSHTGRYVICLNGEIYNHVELRTMLSRDFATTVPLWRGHSDTETLLALIELVGLDKALEHARGMFAFGLWDRAEKKLTLVRDRVGEKPLYYGWAGTAFVFASDLAAIKAHADFEAEICPRATSAYLKRNYVPSPLSIYKRIFKLPPGSKLCVSLKDVGAHRETPFSSVDQPSEGHFAAYWDLAEPVTQGLNNQFSDDSAALSALDAALGESIKMQVRADVPVGAFLSGGIDSSLIVAMIKHHAGVRPSTFTIGFDDSQYDESGYAKAVASHLDTNHHELTVVPRDVIDLIPKLPQIYSEPFADSSQIPTYLVSQLARRSVTVALSGDAGDELFGGYNRYKWTEAVWPKLAPAPFAARRCAAQVLQLPGQRFWRAVSTLPGPLRVPGLGDKVRKISKILNRAKDAESLYLALLDEWDGNPDKVSDAVLAIPPSDPRLSDSAKMMMWDALTYLPDDILCKVDRAAMGVSLETRVPFLDHKVIDIAMRLPPTMRIRNGETKWALRQLLYRHVPRALIERPKAGFGIPVGQWLSGELRDWAESLLDKTSLANDPCLDATAIRARWDEHLSGNRDWTSSLWGILMLQAFKARV